MKKDSPLILQKIMNKGTLFRIVTLCRDVSHSCLPDKVLKRGQCRKIGQKPFEKIRLVVIWAYKEKSSAIYSCRIADYGMNVFQDLQQKSAYKYRATAFKRLVFHFAFLYFSYFKCISLKM